MIDATFWKNKRVFVTGHTGFKGTWLCILLNLIGAKVKGYALRPPTDPSLFELCNIKNLIESLYGDIRDGDSLKKELVQFNPEIVIHLAAQPLVRESYKKPLETYETNIIGTINIFEAIRVSSNVKAVVNVTTDKCYENKEWVWGYRENEPLGGYDPYSCSKACAELITSSYRNSFFNPNNFGQHGVAVATARAGNVIGGGDWASDRLIPDCVRSLLRNEKIIIRNPHAIRPWQHVLEPLSGYLLLAQMLYIYGPKYAEAWNFGPDESDAKSVEWIVDRICKNWGKGISYEVNKVDQLHEANYLKLDCSKAKASLGWYPKWNLDKAIDKTVEWAKAYQNNADIKEVCIKQIEEYCNL